MPMQLRGVVAAFVAALVVAPGAGAALRDDTAWLQAKLDAGGTLELPKLPGGACYRTHGLWVSRDDTTIESSDGACVVGTGPGELRLTDGSTPGRAEAVFFVSNSSVYKPIPVHVTIRDVHVVVPAAAKMDGITVLGHETTVDHVAVTGEPRFGIAVGGALAGPAEDVSVVGSTVSGARLAGLRAFGVIGFQAEGDTIGGGARSGLELRPSGRGQPGLHVSITDNTFAGNAGDGVVLGLHAKNGLPLIATDIDVTGNRVIGNRGAGIRVEGGERDGKGVVTVAGNLVQRNARAVVHVAAPPSTVAQPRPWRPSASLLAAAGKDDTAWLQKRLDAGGGTIFLPALDGGRCYATHGLWVSHDDTQIESDGACVVSLGPGPVRLRSTDGDPIASNAVFFVNRTPLGAAPADVGVSGLHIVVPAHQGMYGVLVAGHDVTLQGLTISGSPIDDVTIGGRANGDGFVGNVAVLDSTLQDAQRNAISVSGTIGLRIDGNTIEGVQDTPGQPGAGIDVEPDDRAQPTLDVEVSGNTIRDAAGPGVLFSLEPNTGPSILASTIAITDNTIERVATRPFSYTRGAIVITGRDDGGSGTVAVTGNTLLDNGGDPILLQSTNLAVTQSANTFG